MPEKGKVKWFSNVKGFGFITKEGLSHQILLEWDSAFNPEMMVEVRDISNFGGISLALFYMCVLNGYRRCRQSEQGEGVDYYFSKGTADNQDLFGTDGVYVEISRTCTPGKAEILERVRKKHEQISRGSRSNEKTAVIVSSLPEKCTTYESHEG